MDEVVTLRKKEIGKSRNSAIFGLTVETIVISQLFLFLGRKVLNFWMTKKSFFGGLINRQN